MHDASVAVNSLVAPAPTGTGCDTDPLILSPGLLFWSPIEPDMSSTQTKSMCRRSPGAARLALFGAEGQDLENRLRSQRRAEP